ncbi:NEL domain-containing protein [Pseudomonas shirazica]|uniref:NEL-type E3 ubiquitin ligase domain-containing protein n=1 Tax=Pseudomonas shirazica TaxID=1940636 RepID=UPI0035237833
MPPTEYNPSYSVDALIAQQLPDWLTSADTTHLQAYGKALGAQQQAADRLRHLLERIPRLEDFALPLLERALREQRVGHIDARRGHVVVSEEFQLPSAAEHFYKPTVIHSTRQTLLAAALHNFEAHEAEPWLLRKAHLENEKGEKLAMTFEQFVRLCRSLDLGGKYQVLLKTVLEPKAGRGQPGDQARTTIRHLFETGVRTRMQAAVYEARFKRQLDERDLLRLRSMLEPPALATYGKGTLTPRQLYLLGKCVTGVITLEWRPALAADIDEIIVWIPDAPGQSLCFYDSWNDVYSDLATRLKQQPFRRFFKRFIKARDTSAFDKELAQRLVASPGAKKLQLDGRNLPIEGDVFAHVRALLLGRMFDDAAYLAVPTDVEDRLSRHQRLQGMLSAGLDLLGLAALVVPVMGDLLLVVSAAQLLDEVYEGYQDWQLGDRQGALDHLFNVAQGLATTGLTAGALHTLGRIPFVDRLAPTVLPGRGVRLARNLRYLPAEEDVSILLEGLQGEHFADTLSDHGRMLLQVTGLSVDQLRRLCLENAPPPARLLDIHDRIKLHQQDPTLKGLAFEQKLQAWQTPLSIDQAKLIGAFRGLSPRGAQEVIDHCSSAQIEQLHASGRIPLSMAQHARWYEHASRIDRACLGLRLQNLTNTDSEILALRLIEREAPWPDSVRVELRHGGLEGLQIFASQSETAQKVRTIVKNEQGYALAGEETQGKSLLAALLRCLDDEQKTRLGNRNLQFRELRDKLAMAAEQDRDTTAGLLDLPGIRATVRPPRRFADGRLAYTLSGGGESSQSAIRRGIHQIFPTLSELQLDAYLEAVRQRGESLWDHYQTLQRQLADLRETLRVWQAGWQSPIDAIRRRRVADTLRRSWRRKLVDGNDQYELTIDGEHIDALPDLPEGVEYRHVRRLTLRNMRLQQIDARFLRLRLQRLNLHDNPLSEGSIEYLDEAQGASETGARGSASYAHEPIDEETRATWVASRNELLRAEREAAWDRLSEEPGSGGLFRFLADFAQSEDFEAHPRHYRRRLWHILEACENNEALREQLFREADGPRTCEDRLLLLLNQMEVDVLAFQGIEGVPAEMRESHLLYLGGQLHRLDLLDDIANRHIQALREAGRRVDEIEVRLFYRLRLTGPLDLPAPPDEMHFASFAHVTTRDLNAAEIEVLQSYSTLSMLDALAGRPYWQNYLRETYADRFEATARPYHERMEALEARAVAGQEAGYEDQARVLMRELAAEESVLIRTLTTEAWARWNQTPKERLMPH